VLSLTPCFGQTTPSESQTLQALLWEVRQLRQDLQTTTIAVQRAQILLCLPKMLSGAKLPLKSATFEKLKQKNR
jgi:hypothetical protein